MCRVQTKGENQESGGDIQGDRVREKGGRHPDDRDVLKERIRGESARNGKAMGHALLSLMAGREGRGHVLFIQAPTRESPPLSNCPGASFRC